MTREEKIKAFGMYLDGATYREIADVFGVTRQCIEQGISGKCRRAPKKFKCVFLGLKRYMDEHGLSIKRFNDNAKVCKYANSLRRKLSGEFEFTISEIKAILSATAMTFEEAFGEVETVPAGDVNA